MSNSGGGSVKKFSTEPAYSNGTHATNERSSRELPSSSSLSPASASSPVTSLPRTGSTVFTDAKNIIWPDWAKGHELPYPAGRRWRMHVPGSEDNPFVVRRQTLKDMIVDVTDGAVLRFEDCTFERAPIRGNEAKTSKNNCRTPDVGQPQSTRVLAPIGSRDNKLIFIGRVFVNTRIELGDVWADFVECTFYDCDVRANGNTNFTKCRWASETPANVLVQPIVFFVLVGKECVFGELSKEELPITPAPEHKSAAGASWARRRSSVKSAVASIVAYLKRDS